MNPGRRDPGRKDGWELTRPDPEQVTDNGTGRPHRQFAKVVGKLGAMAAMITYKPEHLQAQRTASLASSVPAELLGRI